MPGPYDLIVIGTGPGGYVAAIRASQLGMKVAVVEKRSTHGGTCLNVGCIPSKALLHASEAFDHANHGFAAMGIELAPKLNLAKMQAFKAEGVKGNVDGVAYLLKKNKIDSYHGTAKIAGTGKVTVTFMNGEMSSLNAKSIVIATGSDIVRLPGIEIDEKQIVSSTGALELAEVPKKLLVIGAGVIGLELGSVWRRLGSEVVVVEYLDRILPGMDGDVAKSFQRIQEKQGIKFRLASKVTGVVKTGTGLKATVEPAAGGPSESIDADVVLVAVGRVPYTQGLGVAEAGIALDAKKRILVDGHYQTNVAGVYAIGDVIAGPMLAHKAEDEGVAVAELLAGQAGPRELWCHSKRDLYGSRGGVSWQIRRRVEDRRHRLFLGKISIRRQWPRQGQPHHRWFRESPGRCHDRPDPRGPHYRTSCGGNHRRSRCDHGIWWFCRRLGPHVSRPSHIDGGRQGSGYGGGKTPNSYVVAGAELIGTTNAFVNMAVVLGV